MRAREFVTELNFHGRTCTRDCSGHRAGWYWAKRKGAVAGQCASRSPSFTGGCEIAVNQTKLAHPRIRDSRGRFTTGR